MNKLIYKIQYGGAQEIFNAIKYNNPQEVINLISAKANIDARNSNSETPLHQAIKEKNEVILSILTQVKADVNTIDWDGNTPVQTSVHLYTCVHLYTHVYTCTHMYT